MELGKIIFILAIFSLFFGVISTLAMDIVYVFADPVNGTKKLLYDISSTIVNSQNEISKAIKNIEKAKTKDEIVFWTSRIIAGALITLFLIWLFYKILRFFFEAPRPIEKITLILVSMLIVYVITQISAGIFNIQTNPIPFHGFVELIQKANIIAEKIQTVYKA